MHSAPSFLRVLLVVWLLLMMGQFFVLRLNQKLFISSLPFLFHPAKTQVFSQQFYWSASGFWYPQTPNLHPNLVPADEKEGCVMAGSNSRRSFALFVFTVNILLPSRRYLCVYTMETFMSVYKGLWSVLWSWQMRVCRQILLHSHLHTVAEISIPD